MRSLGLVAFVALLSLAFAAPAFAGDDGDGNSTVTMTARKAGKFGEFLCTPSGGDTSVLVSIGSLTSRRSLVLQNLYAKPIYVCVGAKTGCTKATGIRLSSGDPLMSLDVGPGVPVYCVVDDTIAQTAGNGTRYAEVR